MNSTVFYGKDQASRVNRRLSRHLASNRYPPASHSFRRTLTGATKVWRTFSRQADALRFASECEAASPGEHFPCIAFEVSSPGAKSGERRFVVSSLEHYVHEYLQVEASKRHSYEVIPFGRPCKLYLDLEYATAPNPDRDGPVMTQHFIDLVLEKHAKIYSKSEKVERARCIQLDSSTAKKFSRHVIFPDIVFEDNIQAGYFLQFISIDLQRLRQLATDADRHAGDEFFVSKEDGSETLFVDLGVYSRNRNFRLFGSTKRGRNAPLVLPSDSPFAGMSHKQVLCDSLVCYLPNLDKSSLLSFGTEQMKSSEATYYLPMPNRLLSFNASTFMQGYHGDPSPYPDVDAFIQRVVACADGRIRAWQMFTDKLCLSYSISGSYRWCANIGRHHKSNNVTFTVDLRQGVYYQKCFDPDCRHFRSPNYLLPLHIVPNFDLSDIDESFVENCLTPARSSKTVSLQSTTPTRARENLTEAFAAENDPDDEFFAAFDLESIEKEALADSGVAQL